MGVHRRLVPLAGALLVVAACSPTVPSQTVGPNQHFVGLVNGQHSDAQIRVACAGPVWVGRTTHPLAGQTLAVSQVATDGGSTGASPSAIFTSIGKQLGSTATFTVYDAAEPLPTTLDVPCDGTGSVTFSTCFDVLPCSAAANPDVLTVTFVNLAD